MILELVRPCSASAGRAADGVYGRVHPALIVKAPEEKHPLSAIRGCRARTRCRYAFRKMPNDPFESAGPTTNVLPDAGARCELFSPCLPRAQGTPHPPRHAQPCDGRGHGWGMYGVRVQCGGLPMDNKNLPGFFSEGFRNGSFAHDASPSGQGNSGPNRLGRLSQPIEATARAVRRKMTVIDAAYCLPS